jgi:DNA polymerase-3 subunit epsilon
MTGTNWHRGPLALFDTETTGVDPHRDRIVTAAIVETTPGQAQPSRSSCWLIDPGIPIPESAAAIHGITTGRAREDGMDAAGAVHEIAEHLIRLSRSGIPVVGHNVRFDLTMLWADLVRHGSPLADDVHSLRPVIDTMILDRWVDPWRPKQPTARRKDPAKCGSRKLVDTARVYGIRVDESAAHGAEYDALTSGRIAWQICETHAGATVPATELHDVLVGLAREQADSFGAWLVKQGKTDDVAREWPWQPPPVDWSPDQLPHPQREDAPA